MACGRFIGILDTQSTKFLVLYFIFPNAGAIIKGILSILIQKRVITLSLKSWRVFSNIQENNFVYIVVYNSKLSPHYS